MMKYLKELNSDTYYSAASKAIKLGQDKLGKKLLKHSEFIDKLKNKVKIEIPKDSKYQMYFKTVINLEDNRDIEINEELDIKFNGTYEVIDETCTIYYNSNNLYKIGEAKKKSEAFNTLTSFYIDAGAGSNSELVIEDMTCNERFHTNKFSNKKSAINFIKYLYFLYRDSDPNKVNIVRKISGLDPIDYTNEVDEESFFHFINENFGSWKDFQNKINIRTLYDVVK